MTEFKMDTSGVVIRHDGAPLHFHDGLNPLTQGYVEALARSLVEILQTHSPDANGRFERWAYNVPVINRTGGGYVSEEAAREAGLRCIRFSDLAPETVERIREDCEAYARRLHYPKQASRNLGRVFWYNRGDSGTISSDFPPLTPYRGDDGKVYLREAV